MSMKSPLISSQDNLFAAYYAETYSGEVVSHPHGFAAFQPQVDGSFYISDVYVKPEYRRAGVTKIMLDQIKEKIPRGSKIFGTVEVNRPHTSQSLKHMLALGFEFHGVNQAGQIVMRLPHE